MILRIKACDRKFRLRSWQTMRALEKKFCWRMKQKSISVKMMERRRVWREKRTKNKPPHLLNMVVVFLLLWLVWLPVELAHCRLLINILDWQSQSPDLSPSELDSTCWRPDLNNWAECVHVYFPSPTPKLWRCAKRAISLILFFVNWCKPTQIEASDFSCKRRQLHHTKSSCIFYTRLNVHQ